MPAAKSKTSSMSTTAMMKKIEKEIEEIMTLQDLIEELNKPAPKKKVAKKVTKKIWDEIEPTHNDYPHLADLNSAVELEDLLLNKEVKLNRTQKRKLNEIIEMLHEQHNVVEEPIPSPKKKVSSRKKSEKKTEKTDESWFGKLFHSL